jgi:TRAP-type C4-dicarboxylate transport system substrate-binding protein
MEPVTLTVSEPLSARSSNFQALQAFMDQVQEASNGKITFDVYTDATLHPMTEALSALSTGLTDITLYSPPLFAEEVPTTMWATGLGVYVFGSSPQEMLAGSPALDRTLISSKDISQNLADNGAIILSTWVSGSYSLLCTKPIRSLADAQGVLVRTPGAPFSQEVEALGMTNVFLQNSEVYEGLQRGVADCNLNTPATYMNDGLWEFAKYWLPIPASASVGVGYVISKNTWDTLPPVAQNIINEAKAAISVNFLKNAAAANQRWIDEAPGRGVEFIDVPQEMIDVLENAQEERGNALADTAPDLVTSPQSEIDATKRHYDQWVGILADEFGITEPSDNPQRVLDALRSTSGKVDWNRYQQRFTQFLRN